MKLYEIVVSGEEEFAYGLLCGFALGRGKNESVYRCSDYDILTSHHKRSIADRLGLGKRYSNFLIQESMLKASMEALKTFSDEPDIAIEAVQVISGLEFEFKVTVFSKEIADDLQSIIYNRDSSIQISGFDPEEIIKEGAEGAELYAPEHDYTLKGKGKVSGPFSPVLSFYSRLEDIAQVEATPLKVQVPEKQG